MNIMKRWFQVRRQGFTLMEVNLSVLLISVGLLTIFALFPFALQQSEYAILDTHEAMFADGVLSAVEGNAMTIDEWKNWTNAFRFRDEVQKNIYPIDSTRYDSTWKQVGTVLVNEKTGFGEDNAVLFPEPMGGRQGHPRYIRYLLKLTPTPRGEVWGVELQVSSGAYGIFADKATAYYTQVRYMGM